MQTNPAVTCVIPFFNEGERLCKTLAVVSKAQSIDEVICVDDGSSDNGLALARAQFPQYTYVRLKTNQGKSAAVLAGALRASPPIIFLLDADLIALKKSELDQAVRAFTQSQADMLLLRRAQQSYLLRFFRHDILMSGQRILQKSDLLKTYLELPPQDYQLELALNLYMQRHRRRVFWYPSSYLNTYKISKWGVGGSLPKYLNEIRGYVRYAGIAAYLRQFATFCHQAAVQHKHPAH